MRRIFAGAYDKIALFLDAGGWRVSARVHGAILYVYTGIKKWLALSIQVGRIDFRIRLFWFAIALITFGAASWLTMDITTVDVLASNPHHGLFQHGVLQRPDEPQIIGAYIITDGVERSRASEDIKVVYTQNEGEAGAAINVWLPSDTHASFLLNNTTRESCLSTYYEDGTYADIPAGYDDDVSERTIQSESGDNYSSVIVFRPDRTKEPFHFYCNLSSVPEHRTFSKRVARFWFPGKTDGAEFLGVKAITDPDTGLSEFEPASRLAITFDVRGADDFRFDGISQSNTTTQSHSVMLPKDGKLDVMWVNYYQEQFRDIILVVIGSLIAIGAATVIEAIRP